MAKAACARGGKKQRAASYAPVLRREGHCHHMRCPSADTQVRLGHRWLQSIDGLRGHHQPARVSGAMPMIPATEGEHMNFAAPPPCCCLWLANRFFASPAATRMHFDDGGIQTQCLDTPLTQSVLLQMCQYPSQDTNCVPNGTGAYGPCAKGRNEVGRARHLQPLQAMYASALGSR